MKIDKNAVYGVYVHIPFCLKKCAYCDFTSYPGLLSKADCYLEDVAIEMEQYKGICTNSVYIGGGTPTCLKKEQLLKLIDKIKSTFLLSDDCEFTVECNPKTADYDYFCALHNAGVNRLSIGVQSFNNDELKLLGRVHNANEAKDCIQMAKKAGFSNFNLDLMFGLPNQTVADFEKSISEALSLKSAHISCYSLILEEGTKMHEMVNSGTYVLPEEDEERKMYHTLIEMLLKNGYEHYEISNFALSGKQSRHNNKYWDREPYIGIGAAAHSNINDLRFGNPVELDLYSKIVQNNVPIGRETEELTQKDKMAEFVFLGLRKIKGISKIKFKDTFGIDIYKIYGEQIKKFCDFKLLEDDGDTIRLTLAGIDVSNSVFCEFL